MYSLIIKNAQVIDGTGSPAITADVAVEGAKIVAVSPSINSSAQDVINAKGQVLAPGFIDVQNHSDSHWQLLDNPSLDSLVTQGYTTILVGNSGASLAPLLSPDALLSLQKWHTLEGANINWRTFEEFATAMQARSFGCNVASLIGYSTLRRGLVGDRLTPLTVDELEVLKNQIDESLQAGALGVSTGLSYAHELVMSEIELYEIARVVKKHDRLLSLHIRNEGPSVVESVREIVALAQQSEANVKIAHLKIRGSNNWQYLPQVLDELEGAWHQGTNIHFDAYPYTSTWQALYSYLPAWAIQGGRNHLLEQLRNPVQRNKIISSLINSETDIKNLIIASTSNRLHVTGKTIANIAGGMGVSSEEAVLRIIENGGSEILVFDICLDESNVEALTTHALSFVATNGSGYSNDHRQTLIHPRCFGSAPKFLRNVIDKKSIPLHEAIRKLTSGPATKLGLKDRGVIAVGAAADLVLFDPGNIKDRATVSNPFQYATGITGVWVNGQPAVMRGATTNNLSGQFLTAA
jgi:N-acyl-D-amino-acid deacylase